MNRGDIVLVEYPFTDHSGSKVRPALVVSGDEFNRGQDRNLAAISTNFDPDDPFVFTIRVGDPHFTATGLKRDSAIRFTKILTLDKRVILRKLGFLDAKPLAEVLAKIRAIFDV